MPNIQSNNLQNCWDFNGKCGHADTTIGWYALEQRQLTSTHAQLYRALQAIEEGTLHQQQRMLLTLLTTSAGLQPFQQNKLVVPVGLITLHQIIILRPVVVVPATMGFSIGTPVSLPHQTDQHS